MAYPLPAQNHTALGADTSNLTGVAWFIGDFGQLSVSIQSSTASASRYTFVATNDDGLQSALGVPSMLGNANGWSIMTTITSAGMYTFDPTAGFRWMNCFRDNISVSANSNTTIRYVGRNQRMALGPAGMAPQFPSGILSLATFANASGQSTAQLRIVFAASGISLMYSSGMTSYVLGSSTQSAAQAQRVPLVPSGFGPPPSFAGGAVITLSGAGPPTNGIAGTGVNSANSGALYIDITNGDMYINRASSSSVSWHGTILA